MRVGLIIILIIMFLTLGSLLPGVKKKQKIIIIIRPLVKHAVTSDIIICIYELLLTVEHWSANWALDF